VFRFDALAKIRWALDLVPQDIRKARRCMERRSITGVSSQMPIRYSVTILILSTDIDATVAIALSSMHAV